MVADIQVQETGEEGFGDKGRWRGNDEPLSEVALQAQGKSCWMETQCQLCSQSCLSAVLKTELTAEE